ncbi:DUF3080 domain-containing protein [Vibrio metoecus]
MHRKTLLLFLLAILSGCDHQAAIEDDFASYLTRIANVQEQAAFTPPAWTAQSVSPKRELMTPLEPLTIGLLDSYELRQCGLFERIAQRNSILGKVQDAFREWDFQIALLNGLDTCLLEPKLSPALKAQLLEIKVIKQQELPSRWNNLLYTSDVMRSQLSGAKWYDANWSTDELLFALQQLNQIDINIKQRLPIPELSLFTQQEILEKQRLLGHLKFSLDRATDWLDTLSRQLIDHDDVILCGVNRNQTKLTYLRNVFQSQYIEKVQPYLASLDQAYYQFAPQLSLFNQLNSPFPIQASHQRFRDAIQKHAHYWQQLFKRCGITVGANQ